MRGSSRNTKHVLREEWLRTSEGCAEIASAENDPRDDGCADQGGDGVEGEDDLGGGELGDEVGYQGDDAAH